MYLCKSIYLCHRGKYSNKAMLQQNVDLSKSISDWTCYLWPDKIAFETWLRVHHIIWIDYAKLSLLHIHPNFVNPYITNFKEYQYYSYSVCTTLICYWLSTADQLIYVIILTRHLQSFIFLTHQAKTQIEHWHKRTTNAETFDASHSRNTLLISFTSNLTENGKIKKW